jgi:hypothetical protein
MALRKELGDTHRGTKIVMRWTGASDRTVKNWFAATRGPTGEHLIPLIRHSNEVLGILLCLAGRESSAAVVELIDLGTRLSGMIGSIDEVLARKMVPDKKG